MLKARIVAVVTAATLAGAIAVGPAIPAQAATVVKATQNLTFKPKTLNVHKGTKVVWKNRTSALHTVTRCGGTNCPVSGGTGTDGGLSSPAIASGSKYAFVFHGKGTYVYYCSFHGYAVMHGTITVT